VLLGVGAVGLANFATKPQNLIELRIVLERPGNLVDSILSIDHSTDARLQSGQIAFDLRQSFFNGWHNSQYRQKSIVSCVGDRNGYCARPTVIQALPCILPRSA
jgi:hypothetical protein